MTILVELEKRKEDLSKPTADDPVLVQLREDAQQSTKQLAEYSTHGRRRLNLGADQ